jgi:hypothetical protein
MQHILYDFASLVYFYINYLNKGKSSFAIVCDHSRRAAGYVEAKLHTGCGRQFQAGSRIHFQTAIFPRQECSGTVGQVDEWIRYFGWTQWIP